MEQSKTPLPFWKWLDENIPVDQHGDLHDYYSLLLQTALDVLFKQNQPSSFSSVGVGLGKEVFQNLSEKSKHVPEPIKTNC